jgi:hypothetical protein
MRSVGPEVGDVNRRQVSARRAGKFANKKPFQPPLNGTQEVVNPDGSGDDED